MPMSPKSRYWTFHVNSLDINKMRNVLIYKFSDKTLLAWAEKKDGMFYVYFKAPAGYVKKTMRHKLKCLLDMQEIISCTIDEINQAIDSTDAIYKQDNRRHKGNKKLSAPVPVSVPILTAPALTVPIPTAPIPTVPIPTAPIPTAPVAATAPALAHTSANIYNNPNFFDLDKSYSSNSEEDD